MDYYPCHYLGYILLYNTAYGLQCNLGLRGLLQITTPNALATIQDIIKLIRGITELFTTLKSIPIVTHLLFGIRCRLLLSILSSLLSGPYCTGSLMCSVLVETSDALRTAALRDKILTRIFISSQRHHKTP